MRATEASEDAIMGYRKLGNSALAVGLFVIAALVVHLGFLALSGCGHKAYAAQGEFAAASTASGKPTTLSASASSKKSVYVIAEADGWKYSYNKYGLLTKTENPMSVPYKITYKYDSKMRPSKFKAVPKSPNVRKSNGTFAYDKKGRLTEIVSNGSHGSNDYRVTFKYNKKGYPSIQKWYWRTYNRTVTSKSSFDKKGRLVKSGTSRFSYDSKGNLRKAGAVTWANTYESGRLVLKTRTESSFSTSTAYKYKRISVPKKYVSQVKKQQWALLNREASFVFPPYF